MKRFDVHLHLGDPEKVDDLARELKRLDMIAAVSPSDPFRGPVCNDEVEEASRKYPELIIPFGYIGLGRGDKAKTVEDLHQRGFKGLKFICPKKDYDDPEYFPIYERAEALKMPALFHTGIVGRSEDDRGKDISSRRMRPVNLDAIAREFPNLTIIMAHLGTTAWRQEAAYTLRWNPNILFDLAGSGSYKKLKAKELLELLNWTFKDRDPDLGGFQRMVFGSDGGGDDIRVIAEAVASYEEILNQIGAPPELKQEIMGGRMLRMLGLAENR